MAAVSMTVTVGDGASARLWTDSWAPVGPLCHFAPQLYAAISRAGKKRTVKDGVFQHRWARDIVGAPTVQVLCQYLRVWRIIRDLVLHPLQEDRFVWRWSTDGKYSASSAYQAFFAGSVSMPGAKELWRTKAPARVKFFFWIALHRRLWTAHRRKKHGLQDGDACVLCDQEPETCDHLFVACVVARELWASVLAPAGLLDLLPTGSDDLESWWLGRRQRFEGTARATFDSMVLLISWTLWKERNERTFSRNTSTNAGLLQKVIKEANDWVLAGFRSLAPFCSLLSQNSVAM